MPHPVALRRPCSSGARAVRIALAGKPLAVLLAFQPAFADLDCCTAQTAL